MLKEKVISHVKRYQIVEKFKKIHLNTRNWGGLTLLLEEIRGRLPN